MNQFAQETNLIIFINRGTFEPLLVRLLSARPLELKVDLWAQFD